MTIETKFDVGEEVYIVNNGKALFTTIKSINIRVKIISAANEKVVIISYVFEVVNRYNMPDIIYLPENQVFKTKEELIQSF